MNFSSPRITKNWMNPNLMNRESGSPALMRRWLAHGLAHRFREGDNADVPFLKADTRSETRIARIPRRGESARLLFIRARFSADDCFVYVISDLISTFADSAPECLRYGETVSTWSRLKRKRAFIVRQRANSIYPRDLWSLHRPMPITLTPQRGRRAALPP